MDTEGKLLADKLKDVFRKHKDTIVNKVTEMENFVDTCITQSGELK
jgi:nitrogen fixation/metabolism regulation signal transduction histidine kinase